MFDLGGLSIPHICVDCPEIFTQPLDGVAYFLCGGCRFFPCPPRAGGGLRRKRRRGGRCTHATGPSAARHKRGRSGQSQTSARGDRAQPCGGGAGARADGTGTGPSSKRRRNAQRDGAQPPPPTEKAQARSRAACGALAPERRRSGPQPRAYTWPRRRWRADWPAAAGQARPAHWNMRGAAQSAREGAACCPWVRCRRLRREPPRGGPRGYAEHYLPPSGGRCEQGAPITKCGASAEPRSVRRAAPRGGVTRKRYHNRAARIRRSR